MKKNGESEWSFCSFHKAGRPFQDWLDEHYATKAIQVTEHPTTDSVRVSYEILTKVSADISRHLHSGRTVVVMDSGGMERTGQVCSYLQAAEDFSG
jgi:hypothetical protein